MAKAKLQAKQPHKFVIERPLVNYTPVDSEPKHSAIYLERYLHTTGFIERKRFESQLLGYCAEEPKDILEKAIRFLNVTRYRGHTLIASEHTADKYPKIGLNIDAIVPVYGINGKFDELFRIQTRLFAGTERNVPATKGEISEIIEHIASNDQHNILSPNRKQMQFEINELAGVLQRFSSSLRK